MANDYTRALIQSMLQQRGGMTPGQAINQGTAQVAAALLSRGAQKKDEAQRQESAAVNRQIAESLLGGTRVISEAGAVPSDGVGPTRMPGSYQTDPDLQRALSLALSNPDAIGQNPMLQQMIAAQLRGPAPVNVPAGGALVDPRTQRELYRNPTKDGSEPLEIIMGPNGPQFASRSQAAGQRPYQAPPQEPEIVRAYRFAKSEGYKGSLDDFRRSDKREQFSVRAADAGLFSRSAAEAFGGFYDPITGQFSGLDPETAAKAARLSADAARIWRESEGDISHNEAFADALGRLRQPAQRTPAPQAAIEHLKQNPRLKAQFKAKYGYLPEGL